MASRKEEKERLRQEREEAERKAQASGRSRLVIGYVVAGAIALVVVVGLVMALTGGDEDSTTAGGSTVASDDCSEANTEFGGIIPDGIECDNREGTAPPEVELGELAAAAKAAGCDLQLNLKDEGSTHLDPKDDLPKYGTNPPTSGDHYPVPLADGAYLATPSPGNYIHSLEHGRIEIQYSSDLPEEDQLALKGVLDADSAGVDMFPNDDMPYDVAVTAWTQLMSCDTFEDAATLDAIRAFREAYRGRGPEAIPY